MLFVSKQSNLLQTQFHYQYILFVILSLKVHLSVSKKAQITGDLKNMQQMILLFLMSFHQGRREIYYFVLSLKMKLQVKVSNVLDCISLVQKKEEKEAR